MLLNTTHTDTRTHILKHLSQDLFNSYHHTHQHFISSKTHLPISSNLFYQGYERQIRRPRCIILVPTRDLARQILGSIKDLSHFSKVCMNRKIVVVIYGIRGGQRERSRLVKQSYLSFNCHHAYTTYPLQFKYDRFHPPSLLSPSLLPSFVFPQCLPPVSHYLRNDETLI